jgi:hypothetical protein
MSAEQAISRLRAADTQYRQALRQHRLAPPDARYSARLKDFANACEQQEAAYRYADDNGLAWDPLPPSAGRRPPAELQPDSGRRGPEDLWKQFDTAIEDLSLAFEGISLSAIARVFGELSDIARRLSIGVAEQDAAAARGRRVS